MINKKEFDKVTNTTPGSHWSCLLFCCHFANEQKGKKIAKTRQTRYQNAVLLFVVFVLFFCFVIVSYFCKTL